MAAARKEWAAAPGKAGFVAWGDGGGVMLVDSQGKIVHQYAKPSRPLGDPNDKVSF